VRRGVECTTIVAVMPWEAVARFTPDGREPSSRKHVHFGKRGADRSTLLSYVEHNARPASRAAAGRMVAAMGDVASPVANQAGQPRIGRGALTGTEPSGRVGRCSSWWLDGKQRFRCCASPGVEAIDACGRPV
jgi:hypothetical protein